MGAPLKDVCLRGHVIAEVGRRRQNGQCIACHNERDRKKRYDSRKRYCKHGHDTYVCGRYPNGGCVQCWKLTTARRTWDDTVPTVRIRVLIHDRSDAAWAYAQRFGVTKVAAKRRLTDLYGKPRIQIDTADRWCLALNTHLSIVYPELYGLRAA